MASRLPIGEVFGFGVTDNRPDVVRSRRAKLCPFQGSKVVCTKDSSTDPLGICSYEAGGSAVTVCPYRFRESGRIFRDTGKLAFGAGSRIIPYPEYRLLRVGRKRIGKIDYLILRLDANSRILDFAALEVQSVYTSGMSIRPAFRKFLKTGRLSVDAASRPDFRSSAQKRLMPQLSIKVPIFRRWGKAFFVAVDRHFFNSLPQFNRTTSFGNSEVTWLVYGFEQKKGSHGFSMSDPEVVFTQWDEVQTALREGTPPERDEIIAECQDRLTEVLERGFRPQIV